MNTENNPMRHQFDTSNPSDMDRANAYFIFMARQGFQVEPEQITVDCHDVTSPGEPLMSVATVREYLDSNQGYSLEDVTTIKGVRWIIVPA
jgi:hypothetical protein